MTIIYTDWVDCPVCGESDMARVHHCDVEIYGPPDPADTYSYINCVNGSCGSNGGDDFWAYDNRDEEEEEEDDEEEQVVIGRTVGDALYYLFQEMVVDMWWIWMFVILALAGRISGK